MERQPVLIAYGTRPEAIKLAPVIRRIARSSNLEAVVVSTGQHDEVVRSVERVFGITPAFELRCLTPGQTLNELLARVIIEMDHVLAEVSPRAAAVHGDTTSALGAGLALHNRGVSLVHVEAGLRTRRLQSPFPEEANRRVLSHISDLHLAPSTSARSNLLREGVPVESIVVTGNTGIEAMRWARSARANAEPHHRGRLVIITLHRRENWSMVDSVARAIARVAKATPSVQMLVVAHINPAIQQKWINGLAGVQNVELHPPMPYIEFIDLLCTAALVVTDSGGVQEEAADLGIETIVLRPATERHEAVQAHIARLVATDEDAITQEMLASLGHSSRPDAPRFSYGDGDSSLRAVAAIQAHLGVGHRMPDYVGSES